MKECLELLRRTFPGIHGRIIDLCKPTQRKYDTAISTLLGKNMDAVVVDSHKTGCDCVQFIKAHRYGPMTFIPLDNIEVQAINDRYRTIHRGARLAIDCLSFESIHERALQFATGNSLIADDMDVAKDVLYTRGEEVKCVTLEGVVFRKNGNISGGQPQSSTTRWEDKEVEQIRKVFDRVARELEEIRKERRRLSPEESIRSEVQDCESSLRDVQENLKAVERRIASQKGEMGSLDNELKALRPRVKDLEEALAEFEEKMEGLQSGMNVQEDKIFAAFCKKIKIQHIRVYEEKEYKFEEEMANKKLQFTTTRSKLEQRYACPYYISLRVND